MEVVRMPRVEGRQDLDNRLPGACAPGHEQIAADVECEPIIKDANRVRVEGDQFSVRRLIWRNRRAVVDESVLREPGDYEVDVHPRELLRRGGGAGFHQHFEPHAETIGVELLVPAGLGSAPQVEIKNARQLLRRRQRHELAAILKPTGLNNSVKQIRPQSGDDMLESWRVQNAIEQTTPACRIAPRRLVAGPIRSVGTWNV